MTYLLDSNVVISLATAGHEHHGAATRWLLAHRNFATCPITEGALVRYVKHLAPNDRTSARYLLNLISKMPGWQFWSADISYDQLELEALEGHRQVTGAYLVALAIAKGGRVATFDEALVAVHPQAILIPAEPSA